MVAAAPGMQFLQAGLMMQAFGAYVAVLSEERGWSKTALSGAAALHQMEVAILGPALGWMLDRFGPRRFVRAGVLMFGVGLMLFSQVETLPTFYAAFVVIALGVGFCGFFPLNVAIIPLFERWRARAISSMSIGLAFGGIIVPLVAWSMEVWGWRATAFASGAIVIVVGSWLASMIYNRPADLGEAVDGIHAERPSQQFSSTTANEIPLTRDFTAREALRTPAFWLLALGHGFALFVVSAVNVHAITHMKEGLGYSLEAASLVILLQTLSQIGGIAAGWVIGDRYDKKMISAACMFMHMAGLAAPPFYTNHAAALQEAPIDSDPGGVGGPVLPGVPAAVF